MMGIGRAWLEVEMFIETFGRIIFGVDEERTDTRNTCRIECPQHRILEKGGAQPFTLFSRIHGEPGKDHERHGMTRYSLDNPFRRLAVCDAPDRQAVIADNPAATADNIGLGTAGLLADEGVAFQKAVEFRLAAVEGIRIMLMPDFLGGPERLREITCHAVHPAVQAGSAPEAIFSILAWVTAAHPAQL